MKTSWSLVVVVAAVLLVTILYATDQILPATSVYQAQMRIWMAARATGIVSLLLLTLLVVLGIVLSHPEQSRWKQAKRVFPWHESLWVFAAAFIAVHIVSLVLDEYADVGLAGALVPGLSEYRSVPVGLGVVGTYALVITVVTARFTRLLPAGVWLKLHRLSAVILALAWAHGVLAGTDSAALRPMYSAVAIVVLGAAAYRYWIVRARGRSRPVPGSAATATVPTPSSEDLHVEPRPAP